MFATCALPRITETPMINNIAVTTRWVRGAALAAAALITGCASLECSSGMEFQAP
jgi:hypothetical protein